MIARSEEAKPLPLRPGEPARTEPVVATEAAFRDGDEWLDAVIARLDDNRSLLAQLLSYASFLGVTSSASRSSSSAESR